MSPPHAGERLQRVDLLAGGLGKGGVQHADLLVGHGEDEVGLGDQMAVVLQIGGDAVGGQVDALVAQHQARVERDQRAVARERGDAARLRR